MVVVCLDILCGAIDSDTAKISIPMINKKNEGKTIQEFDKKLLLLQSDRIWWSALPFLAIKKTRGECSQYNNLFHVDSKNIDY